MHTRGTLAATMDEEVCAVCSDPTWVEGNWLLLCDGEHCGKAYHSQCLENPLDELPEGDWLCPCCSVEISAQVFESPSPTLLAAISIGRVAWHAAWHAVGELSAGTGSSSGEEAIAAAAASRAALTRFSAYTARLAEKLPLDLVADTEWLCWHASFAAAYARRRAALGSGGTTSKNDGKPDRGAEADRAACAKEQKKFEARADAIRKRLPAALAEGVVTVATSAASHAANARFATEAEATVELPTGAFTRASDMAAAQALREFEAASLEVQRLHKRLPPLWRGTPIDPAPIAEACKWLAWNAGWHAANERAGHGSDARRAKVAFEEHAAKLAALVPSELSEGFKYLCWNASWRASNERAGEAYAEDAAEAGAKAEEHASGIASLVPSELAGRLCALASCAGWHAANARAGGKGYKADAAKDLKEFEAAAREVRALCGGFPVALPEEGAPERPVRRAKPRRQKWARAAVVAPLTAEEIRNVHVAAWRKLLMRMRRLRAEARRDALDTAARDAWDACPFPALLEPRRYYTPPPVKPTGGKGGKPAAKGKPGKRPKGAAAKDKYAVAVPAAQEAAAGAAGGSGVDPFLPSEMEEMEEMEEEGADGVAACYALTSELDRSILRAGVPPLQLGGAHAHIHTYSSTYICAPSLSSPVSLICPCCKPAIIVYALHRPPPTHPFDTRMVSHLLSPVCCVCCQCREASSSLNSTPRAA